MSDQLRVPSWSEDLGAARRVGRRQGLLGLITAVAVITALGAAAARADDKVTLRTNWLYYGSHSMFFLGIDQGLYAKNGIDVVVKQGNGSGNATRLVANKDSTFAYASAVTMMNLAAQGAPVVAVATIDAQGTDAVIVRPDAGIKTFKDLEGKKVLTTAGAGVNTLFVVAAKNAGADPGKVVLTNVAESALVSSYLQNLAPAMLGGMDDKPAEIEANGGAPPVILNYADYGIIQPGYAIVAHKDMVRDNPDLVRRFVRATVKSWEEAKKNPGAAVDATLKVKPDLNRQSQLEQLMVDIELLDSNNSKGRIGWGAQGDWDQTLALLKQYRELKTDQPWTAFHTNEFLPK